MAQEELILETLMDIKSQQGKHTEAIKNVQNELSELRADCPVWEVEGRVQRLETDKKWYQKIVAIVGGVIGGVLMVAIEWLLNRRD